MTRTIISKSSKRKKYITPTGSEMVFTEMVVYRGKLSDGTPVSTTRHEKRRES